MLKNILFRSEISSDSFVEPMIPTAGSTLTNCFDLKLSAYLHVACETAVGFHLRAANGLRRADCRRAANTCIVTAKQRCFSLLKICKREKGRERWNEISLSTCSSKTFHSLLLEKKAKQTFNLTLANVDLVVNISDPLGTRTTERRMQF